MKKSNIKQIFVSVSTEMVRLDVSPRITAECNQQVTLQCNASSTNGLTIKHMQWSRSKSPLCSVNSKGEISYNDTSLRNFSCQYENGQLSIIFTNLQPLETGHSQHYMCKLRSNKGVKHHYTTVELEGETPFNYFSSKQKYLNRKEDIFPY